jgi:hypothetical protein
MKFADWYAPIKISDSAAYSVLADTAIARGECLPHTPRWGRHESKLI